MDREAESGAPTSATTTSPSQIRSTSAWRICSSCSCGVSANWRSLGFIGWGAAFFDHGDNSAMMRCFFLFPVQARKNRAPHDPVLVAFGQEGQLLGEMGDALPVGRFGEAVGEIGPPIATLRPVGIEQTTKVGKKIAERIGFRRIVRGGGQLDGNV